MKIGFIQMTPKWGNIDANLNTAEQFIRKQNADLLVLPEFFNTGYLFIDKEEAAKYAENIPNGKTTQRLLNLSKETNTVLVAGLPEIEGDSLFNSAILILPDGSCHLYRKTHLFDREKFIFEPGNTGFKVIDFMGVQLGIMICFDWIFPEAARTLALDGADIIVHPSNLVLPFCPQAMITRCIENRVFAITCNRSGREERKGLSLEYIGNSRIISPDGEILASAGNELQSIQVVDIDPYISRNKYVTEHNSLITDRCTEFYNLKL